LTEVLGIAKANPGIEILFECNNHDSGFDTTFQTPVSCFIDETYENGGELLIGEEEILEDINTKNTCNEYYPDLNSAKHAGYEISESLIVRMG
jgi:hypothetical protein